MATQKELKEMIAARTGLAKSYIKDIKVAEVRPIPDHKERWSEKDYSFTYKGMNYKCVEKIVPNKDGEVKYSAKFEYNTVICL